MQPGVGGEDKGIVFVLPASSQPVGGEYVLSWLRSTSRLATKQGRLNAIVLIIDKRRIGVQVEIRIEELCTNRYRLL